MATGPGPRAGADYPAVRRWPALAAEHLLGDSKIRALDAALERWMPGLTNQPGYAGLRGQIALRWVDGESPRRLSRRQPGGRARPISSPPNTLPRSWLVASQCSGPVEISPRAWLTVVPEALRTHPEIGPYLERMMAAIGDGATPPGTARRAGATREQILGRST